MIKVIRFIPTFLSHLWLMVVTHFPGRTGHILRRRYWKTRLRYLGENVLIETGVDFQNPGFIHIEENCWIDKGVEMLAGMDDSDREKVVIRNLNFKGDPGVIYIGKNVHIGIGCIISGISGGVHISDDCCLSAHCKIYAFSHHYRSSKDPRKKAHFGTRGPQDRQCLIVGAICIGENTGVALNSVVLPGTSIPKDCFVSINSVVKPGQYSPNSIMSGNPATKVDDRFDQ